MKTAYSFLTFVLAACCLVPGAPAQTTAFIYQGRLTDGGTAANGTYDLKFALTDALTDGNQVGPPVINSAVAVSDGIFTVTLDFGSSPFTGAARWLEIGVRTNGSAGSFTTLAPRQPVLPTPYGIYSYSAATAASANSVAAANITGTVSLNQLPAAVLTNNQSGVVLSGTFFGNAAGLTNVGGGGGGGAVFWQAVSGTSVQAVANNGYIATGDTEVTITLPPVAKVGDVVRVSGFGSGGWKIAENGGQSILISPVIPGAVTNYTWTTNATPLADMLASSASGAKLVAASGFDASTSTTNGHLYTSADFGVTWTERATNLNNPRWSAVASSADGTKLAATVYGGQIYTSADSGSTWTARANNNTWTGIASSADGTKLVAVAYNDKTYLSADSGATWNLSPTAYNGDNEPWTAVASSADGTTIYRGMDFAGTGPIDVSTDSGASFLPAWSTGAVKGIACSADGTKVYVVSQQVLLMYAPGLGWINREIGLSTGKAIACSADGVRVTVVGWYSIFHSLNAGATWYSGDSILNDAQGYWNAITLSADGTKAAISKNFFGAGQILTGWAFGTGPGPAGYLTGSQYSAVELLYIGGGQFLPVSYVGAITPH